MKDFQDQSVSQSAEGSTPQTTQTEQPVCPVVSGTQTGETKTVEVVSREENNKQRNSNKQVSKQNVVSVAKSTLKLKQQELTDKIQKKGEELGTKVSITRGRLSNMCNGNVNLTEAVASACKALLEDAGYTVKEKTEDQESVEVA